MTGWDDIEGAKRSARQRARAARCSLTPQYCIDAATALSENLLSLPELATARIVLAYIATPEEIDPAPTITALGARSIAVALPRIEAPGVLGVHLHHDEADLDDGPYGLRQPKEDAPRVPLDSVDAVLVPGVAFDETGARLGYGGGYYDRLLPHLRPDCRTIGIAYDEQLLQRIPGEAHDVAVSLVVTPTQVLRP